MKPYQNPACPICLHVFQENEPVADLTFADDREATVCVGCALAVVARQHAKGQPDPAVMISVEE